MWTFSTAWRSTCPLRLRVGDLLALHGELLALRVEARLALRCLGGDLVLEVLAQRAGGRDQRGAHLAVAADAGPRHAGEAVLEAHALRELPGLQVENDVSRSRKVPSCTISWPCSPAVHAVSSAFVAPFALASWSLAMSRRWTILANSSSCSQ